MDDSETLKLKEPDLSNPASRLVVFDLDNTITCRGTWTPFVWKAALAKPIRLFWLPVLLCAAVLYAIRVLPATRMKALMLRTILGGRRESEMIALAEQFVDGLRNGGFRPGAIAALREHQRQGDNIVLATASFEFCAQQVARHFDIRNVVASRAQIQGDTLTGYFEGKNCEAHEKVARLTARLANSGLGGSSIAYTDHHRDCPLLEWADTAVAVNPTDKLREIATKRGWEIVDWSAASSGI